ncbi:MAG: hypothetical protein V9H69_21970 [Anaerolineae bacterium]
MRGASELLAGRIGFIDLSGFDLTEVSAPQRNRLWLRGAFPASFWPLMTRPAWIGAPPQL